MRWRTNLRVGLADLADVPDIVRAPVSLTAVDDAQPPARIRRAGRAAPYRPNDGTIAGTELATKLESLTHGALDRASDILEIDLDPDDDRYPDNLRGLNAAIKTVLHTQVRVDEHRLKARKLDVFPELLAIIAEEEKKRSEAKTIAA